MACFMRHILDMSEYEDKIITVSAWPTRKTERVDLAKKNCSNDFVTVELSSRPLNFRHERRSFFTNDENSTHLTKFQRAT